MARFIQACKRLIAGNFDSEGAADGWVLTSDGADGAEWRAAAGGGGCTDITYADLVTAIGASTLTAGGFYRITDFATTHFIMDGDGTQYLTGDGIVTGATEPLIVQATAVNQIGSMAFSAAYPGDIIYYDWNPANWAADPAFFDYTSSVMIANFRGVITFRHDTILNNYAGYDYRAAKSRRWKTDVAAWNGATNYVVGDHATDIGAVYRAIQNNVNMQPSASTSYWVRLLDLATFEYWNASPVSWCGVPSNAANYADYYLFADAASRNNHVVTARGSATDSIITANVFRETCTNNILAAHTRYSLLGVSCYNNTLDTCLGITLGNSCAANHIGTGSAYTILDESCIYNILGNECSLNVLMIGSSYNAMGSSCQENVLGDGCMRNVFASQCLRNTLIEESSNNRFGADCTDNWLEVQCKYNTFGDICTNNTFGANSEHNIIGSDCSRNTFGPGAQHNALAAASVTFVDFTTATHVYAAYNCDLYIDATLGARLSYVDNDVTTYAAVDA